MKVPRWAHRAYAHSRHYFWMPCDRCGRYFGGHEKGWRLRERYPKPLRLLCPICNTPNHQNGSQS